MKILKKSILFLLMSVILTTSVGCFGRFKATTNLYKWNDNAVRSNLGKTLLFYALSFVQVYTVFGVADLFIFNLIEFWTGRNPLSMNVGEFEYQDIYYQGQHYQLAATKNQMTVSKVMNNDFVEMARFNYQEETKTLCLTKDNDTTILAYKE